MRKAAAPFLEKADCKTRVLAEPGYERFRSRPLSGHCGSMGQEKGSRRMRQHALSRSTENEFSKTRPAIGTHDDQVNFVDLHLFL